MKCKPLVLALLLGSISVDAIKVSEVPSDDTNLAASIDQ